METKTKLTVAQTVWAWDKKPVEPDSTGKARQRRAFVQFCAMNIVAFMIMIISKGAHLRLPMFLSFFSIVILVGGFFLPRMFEAFEAFGGFIARVVGAGLTYALLVPFFFLCFVPGRLILRTMGKDPLQREWNKERKTYWTDKQTQCDVERYKRQF